MSGREDEFEAIIQNSGLAEHFEQYSKSVITLGDLYEGLALLSNVQADLYNYLFKVVKVVQEKNRKDDKNVHDIPQLTPTQALYLSHMFQIAALFLEETNPED